MDRIGRYEIKGEIGRGGFGVVYRAYDPTVGRYVAVKVLTAQNDATLTSRFRAEATTVGSMQHKNIVTVFESGDHAGLPYLVMECLEGSDLQKLLRSGSPLSIFDKIEIMSGIAEGLHYAHEHGVIHRDIKPANIMRLNDGSVKIMDFGIARVTGETRQRLTQSGYMIGSMAYTSPEQFRGAPIDQLCDIWAFGVVFYELLTGLHPFAAADSAASMYRITTEDPTPIQTLLPKCPASIADMAMRLLNKNREERYQTMEDVVFELKEVRRDLSTHEIPALMARIPQLVDAQEFDGAQSAVRRLLDLDPFNTEARRWREQLRTQVKRRSNQPQIDAMLERAAAHERTGDFDHAISLVDSALRLEPLDTVLKSRRQALEAAQARTDRVTSLLKQSQVELESGSLTEAFRLAKEALDLDPASQDAQKLTGQVQSARTARDHDVKLRAGLNRAKGLLLAHSYDEAVAVLSDLAKWSDANPEVMERLGEARTLQKEQEQRLSFAADLEQARQFLRSSHFDRSCALLEDLSRRAPNDRTVAELLIYAKDQAAVAKKDAAINRITAESRTAREQGDLLQALEIIRRGLTLYPREDRLMREEVSLIQLQRDRLMMAEIEAGLSDARKLLLEGRLEASEAHTRALAARFPANLAIPELQGQIAALMHARESQRQQDKEAQREAQRDAQRAREQADVRKQQEAEALRQREVEDARRQPEAEVFKQQEEEKQKKVAAHQELIAKAQQAFRSRRFDEAVRLAAQAVAANPADGVAPSLLTEAQKQYNDEQHLQLIERARAAASRLARNSRPEDAAAALQAILQQYPSERRVRDDLQVIQESIRVQQSRQTARTLREKAQRLIAQGNLDEAITILQAPSKDDSGIATDLHFALEAKRLRDQLSGLEDLFRQGQAAEVRQKAQELLAVTENPRARELLDWAQRTLTQEESVRGRVKRAFKKFL